MSSNRPIGNKGCPDRNTDLDIVHLSFGPAISGGSVCDHQALYCVMLGSGSFRKAHSGKVDRVNADLYLRRALGTLIISQRAVPTPIKCATSKSKFTISINTSNARTILAGSVIAIPGGCDTVLTINNDMLKATQ